MMHSLLLVVWLVAPVHGYSGGPPEDVCASMMPHHDNSVPQTKSSPYKLNTSKTKVNQGSTVTVTLTGSEVYKGFMIQARTSDDQTVGTFIQNDRRYMSCNGGTNNTVSHKKSSDKLYVHLEWKAPDDYEGQVKFRATFVKEKNEFWVGVESNTIEIEQQIAFPGGEKDSKTTATTIKEDELSQKGGNKSPVEDFYTKCESAFGCFGKGSCIQDRNCKIAAAYRETKDGMIEVELMGEAPGYVAIGFSNDDSMGEDAVVHCVNDGGEITVHKSYNVARGKDNQMLDTQTGVSEMSGSYTDGRLSCKFVLEPKFEIPGETFNLDKEPYHIMLAAANGKDGFHDIDKFASEKEISMDHDGVDDSSGATSDKLHAALITAVWVGAARFLSS